MMIRMRRCPSLILFVTIIFESISILRTEAFVTIRSVSSSRSVVRRNLSVESPTSPVSLDELNERKAGLVFVCSSNLQIKSSLSEVREAVDAVESLGKQLNIGQESATKSSLLSGEWELLWSPQDITRSSPFFWAFQKAFPDSANSIFEITDSIPSPIKDVGPAFQVINFRPPETSTTPSATSTTPPLGNFVSKVKVATLGGMATSIMTTRATIVDVDGDDGIVLQIDTTKPEQSTVVETFLGPLLGAVVNENLPSFPSGKSLEAIRPGSSKVILRTTFCDDSLRISRNGDAQDEMYVWRRREFASFEML